MSKPLKNPYRKIYIHINSQCNHKCCSCILTDDFKEKNLTLRPKLLSNALELLEFDDNTIIEISGGEPTLHPFFIDILEAIREQHKKTISLLTNGSTLAKNAKLREKIFEIIDELTITVYSPFNDIEYRLTKDPLSLKSKLYVLKEAYQFDVKSHLKTLVTQLNYKDLPLIVEKIIGSTISHININAIHLINKAWKNREYLAVKYSKAAPYVERAADKYEELGITGSLVYPMCLIDPYYWRYFPVGFGDVIRRTLSININGKVNISLNLQKEFFNKPDKCSSCLLKERCYWPSEGYINYFGDGELNPIIKKIKECKK